jgi:hypothetical protein
MMELGCNDESTATLAVGSHVESATYPLPKSLSHCLQASIDFNHNKNNANSSVVVELDTIQDAVSSLIGNCIEALDKMYFMHHRLYGNMQHSNIDYVSVLQRTYSNKR